MTPRFIDTLEKKFRFLQIRNLPAYIVFGQVFVYLMILSGLVNANEIALWGRGVISGTASGNFSYLVPLFFYPFLPPLTGQVVGLLFTLYMTYMVARFLESSWGSFKFTLYVVISYLVIVVACFAFPSVPIYNKGYFYMSIFIAFAYTNPNFVFQLFFLFPVKVKWLALLTWMILLYSMVFAEGMSIDSSAAMVVRMQVVSAVLPFFIFFGADILLRLKQKKRRAEFSSIVKVAGGVGRHQCRECDRTEITDPDLEFRYKEIDGSLVCYCVKHMPRI